MTKPQRGEVFRTARGDWRVHWPTGHVSPMPNEETARACAAVAGLVEACEAQHKALDWLFAMLIEHNRAFMPSRSAAWPAMVQGNAALAAARGEEPTP